MAEKEILGVALGKGRWYNGTDLMEGYGGIDNIRGCIEDGQVV